MLNRYVEKAFPLKKAPTEIDAKSSKTLLMITKATQGTVGTNYAIEKTIFKGRQFNQKIRSNPDNYTKTFYKFAKAVQEGVKILKKS